jgi:hypothetical protein
MCCAWPAALRVTNTTLPIVASNPGGVVLEEAVLAVGAGEVELLGVIERVDVGHNEMDGLGALDDAVHGRALDGDVVGQAVQPDRMGVGGRDTDAVEAGDSLSWRASLGERLFALRGHGSSSSVGNTAVPFARPVVVATGCGRSENPLPLVRTMGECSSHSSLSSAPLAPVNIAGGSVGRLPAIFLIVGCVAGTF